MITTKKVLVAEDQPMDVFLLKRAFATVRVAYSGAAEQSLDGVVDVPLLDAEKLQPILIDRDPKARL